MEIYFQENTSFPFGDFTFNLSGIINEGFYPVIKTDARVLGELIETALDLSFSDIQKVEGNRAYDMETLNGERTIEVRVLGPNSKVNFNPSSKAARIRAKKDKSVIYNKVEAISDWIFVKAEDFPIVSIYHLDGTHVHEWLRQNMNKTNTYSQSVIKEIKELNKSERNQRL